MDFKKYVASLLQNGLLLNFVVTIILAVIEKFMELEFICAPQPYNKAYFGIFLLAPAGIFFFLNVIVQGYVLNSVDVKKEKWYCILWQTSFPPWMWFVIVLLDGRYLQCALSTNHDPPKNSTNFEIPVISKIAGLILLLFITALMLLNYLLKSQKSNPEPNPPENPESWVMMPVPHQPSTSPQVTGLEQGNP